jgi:hypothetical protein
MLSVSPARAALCAALIAALTTLGAIADARAASPYGTFPACVDPGDAYESQVWDGDEHVHTGACLPIFAPLTQPTAIDVRTLGHHNDGTLTLVRWAWQSSVVESHAMKVPLLGAQETTRYDTLTVRPDAGAAGYNELRFTSNVVDPVKGRWYTSTRWPMANRGSTAAGYSGGPTAAGRCGAAGWYGQYLNVYIDCRDLARLRSGPVASGTVVRLKFEHERGVATIDPNFHQGLAGNVRYDGAGANTWRQVTLTGAPGWHKLHFRTEHTRTSAPTGTFAAAFVVPFRIG